MANAYMIGNQTIIQRCLAAKSVWHAKASMIWAALLKMCIPVLVLFPGMIALVLHPGLADGDTAVPTMIKSLLPPGLRGLLFAAFLAGLMSTIDSLLNSTATLWTKDIYQRFLHRSASDSHYLLVGRVATLVLLILGVVTSPASSYFPGIYVAVQTFLSFFQGPVFAVLLLGIFVRRITPWGGLAGLVGGISVSFLLYLFKAELFTIEDPFLYVSWWSFLAGIGFAIVVSLFTRPHPIEKLAGFVYGIDDRSRNSGQEGGLS
jgi:SSS family solute:Na+ symporter